MTKIRAWVSRHLLRRNRWTEPVEKDAFKRTMNRIAGGWDDDEPVVIEPNVGT